MKPEEQVGQILGGTYRLERLIGQGGFGAIYEAAHLRHNRRFAVKLLGPDVATDPLAYARFQREAQITSRLGHPHIVEVSDFNVAEDGNPYLVMELLDGESLAARLVRRGRLTLAEAISVARQVTSALHVAHEQGIIHRDLKPENVFLCRHGGRDDYVKLLDFGISKVLGANTKLTRANTIMGSPGYLAPEQIDDHAGEVDIRADIYAMGTLLFEMLIGRPPFQASTITTLLFKVLREEAPNVRELRPEVPERVAQVIACALHKSPAGRQASVAELWRALESASAEQEVDYFERTEVADTAWTPARETSITEPTTPLDAMAPAAAAPAAELPPQASASASGSITPVFEGRTLPLTRPPAARRLLVVALALIVVSGAVVTVLTVSWPGGKGSRAPAVRDTAVGARGVSAADTRQPQDSGRFVASAARDSGARDSAPPERIATDSARGTPDTTSDAPRKKPGRPSSKRQQTAELRVGVIGVPPSEVFVNDKSWGETPFRRRFPVGKYRVMVRSRDGRSSPVREIVLAPEGNEPVQFKFK